MADLPISSAAALNQSTISAGDLFPVLDISAAAGNKGSKITLTDLTQSVNATLLGSANTFTAANTFATGVITSNIPAIHFSQTWNNGAVGFSAFTSDITSVAADYSNTSQINLKLNGTSIFKMGHAGTTFFGADNAAAATLVVDTNNVLVSLRNGAWLDWMGDTGMYREAACILAVRATTNPCSLRVYGTFTDANNYERLSFITTAGAYSIKPEAAGTGALRTLQISGLPTSNPGPGILWNNAGTPAIGT